MTWSPADWVAMVLATLQFLLFLFMLYHTIMMRIEIRRAKKTIDNGDAI